MEFGLETSQLIEQSQVLTQQMIQSLHVLQMPSTELYNYITKEIESNPVITFESIDFAERTRRTPKHHSESQNDNSYITEQIPDNENLPIISLRIQFSMKRPPQDVERIGYNLINLLDQNGYINNSDIDYLTHRLCVPQDRIDLAIQILQSLEPAGVGARNPQECILLQLDRLGLRNGDAWIIVENYLELLSKNQLPIISRKSGLPMDRIVHAKKLIRTLNPHPLILESKKHNNQYVVPDIRIFRKDKGSFIIELNQLKSESIKIDSTYSQIFKDTESESVRIFLNENMKRATWLKDSLRLRCETLEACSNQLLLDQHDFFEYGPTGLKPYSRKEMANKLEKSESTVSRAFKGKYIECDWGVFPSDYFFPKQTKMNQPSVTRNEILRYINEIISMEDKRKPFSDEALSEELMAKGFNISRRTVAKYRGELDIPFSGRRKVY